MLISFQYPHDDCESEVETDVALIPEDSDEFHKFPEHIDVFIYTVKCDKCRHNYVNMMDRQKIIEIATQLFLEK